METEEILTTGRATYDGPYGVRHVGPAYPIDGRGWLRQDVWAPHDGETLTDRVHAAGRDDISNSQPGNEYTSRCGWCYLGTSHTRDAHAVSMAAYA